MEKWLKVLSIISIFFCGISLIGSASNPRDLIYCVLLSFIWVPQSILALLLIGRLRKIRNFIQEHVVIPGRAFLYRLCSDEIPN
jgi:hypothetical protein